MAHARTPNKTERACDTLLTDLRERLEANEVDHVSLTTAITMLERTRRSAIRVAVSAGMKKKTPAEPTVPTESEEPKDGE